MRSAPRPQVRLGSAALHAVQAPIDLRRWLPASAVMLWLAFVGWAIWQHVQASGQPLMYDAITYWLKAKNVWASVAHGNWVNPLGIDPTTRPPGTVLMSYPFGFVENHPRVSYFVRFSASFFWAPPCSWSRGDLQTSHVLPALIRKFHEAKLHRAASVAVWGSGSPRREFLHVDDCADACLFLMQNYEHRKIVNIGVGSDISIRDLADLIRRVVAFSGEIHFDASKPDGTPRKLVDVSKIEGLGWKAGISLEEGIRSTFEWYLSQPDI